MSPLRGPQLGGRSDVLGGSPASGVFTGRSPSGLARLVVVLSVRAAIPCCWLIQRESASEGEEVARKMEGTRHIRGRALETGRGQRPSSPGPSPSSLPVDQCELRVLTTGIELRESTDLLALRSVAIRRCRMLVDLAGHRTCTR